MPLPISESVVVITGASSGIGRATARAFARRGETLALAARREGPLQECAEECRELGAQAIAVPTDVSDEQQVRRLAAAAISDFGRVDTWVNNAAVSLFARLEEAPLDEVRQVLDTNLFGYLHGARAALPYFREQGSGVLINNASVVAEVTQPYVGAYVLSKAAIRALGAVLRQELMLDGCRGIHVCTVMPGMIDTPLLHHAGNHTGRAPKPMPFVYPPERVARTIVNLARFPRREVYVGNAARSFALQHRMAPGLTERTMARVTERRHLAQDEPAPSTTGALFTPVAEGTDATGGWHGRRAQNMRRAATVLVGAGAGLAWVTRRRGA